MATPRLLPLPFYNNLQVQYVCSASGGNGNLIGSDQNGGTSWLYPKETFLAAYDALPAQGGIIHVMGDVHVGGEVPGQGIWIGDNGQQLFPGWRASKKLTVYGYASGAGAGEFSLSQATILPGRAGDVTKPTARFNVGLWLSATNHPIYVNGLLFYLFDVPGRIAVNGNPGLDPDAAPQRSSAFTTANFRYDVCTFQTPDSSGGRDQGPCMDMGYFLFGWMEQCSFNQANLDQPYLSDRRAGVLVNPSDGSSQLFMYNCYGANGGVIYYNGPSNWSVNISSYLVEAAGGNPLPPIIKLHGCGAFGSGYINNIVGADASNTPALVDNTDNASMPPGALVVILGGGSGGEVLGPATVFGGFPAGNPATTVMPSAKGQMSFQGNVASFDTDVVRFNSPVITNRFYNMIPMRDGSQGTGGNVIYPPHVTHDSNRVWTQAGATGADGTVNSPIPDRHGGMTGIRISSNNGSNAGQKFFQVGQNVAAGDIYIVGAWFRTSVPLTFSPFTFGLGSGAGTSTFSPPPALQQPWGTDGQWMFVCGHIQVLTASGGATATVDFEINVAPGIPVDLDPNDYFIIKTSLTALGGSANELGNVMQSLVSYVQAPLGAATTQPGQMLIAQGGLGVGNAVSATTPGSVVKKVQIFDNFGNSLGYVPVYSSIS